MTGWSSSTFWKNRQGEGAMQKIQGRCNKAIVFTDKLEPIFIT